MDKRQIRQSEGYTAIKDYITLNMNKHKVDDLCSEIIRKGYDPKLVNLVLADLNISSKKRSTLLSVGIIFFVILVILSLSIYSIVSHYNSIKESISDISQDDIIQNDEIVPSPVRSDCPLGYIGTLKDGIICKG